MHECVVSVIYVVGQDGVHSRIHPRIREVFEECHKGLHTHSKLVKKFRKIYDAVSFKLSHLEY